MRKPRSSFAAPFVLVIGCGQPQEHAATPHRHHHHPRVADVSDARPIEEPAGEPTEEAIDAAVHAPIDAIGDGVSLTEQCRNPTQYHVICNPPPPTRSRVLSYSIQGDVLMVMAGSGSDQGINKDWKATVVEPDGTLVHKSEAVIVRVDKTRTLVAVKKLTVDELQGGDLRINFSPP